MSTRCNVIVKDKFDKIWLYHHHDGYVEGVDNTNAEGTQTKGSK